MNKATSTFIIPSSVFIVLSFSLTFAVLSQTTGVVTLGKVAGRWLLVSDSTKELNYGAAGNYKQATSNR